MDRVLKLYGKRWPEWIDILREWWEGWEIKTVTPKNNQLRWSRFGCYSLESISTYLEFTVTLQSNNLIPHKNYTKKQQVVYQLIKYLHEEEGLGYRKISQKLNSWGIKTQRGKKWFNTSVFSVLKRKHQRDLRTESVRDKEYPVKISKLSLKYQTFS